MATRAIRTCIAALWGAALSTFVLTASAQEAAANNAVTPRSDTVAPQSDGLGNHQKNIRLDIGDRTQFVSSKGLDAFSRKDALSQLTLGASWGFWARDRFSLAAAAGFDYGGKSASLRSDDASLDLLRFSLAPEARYHVLRVLAVTAKVGPTLTRQHAEVAGGLGSSLFKTAWRMGFDATAGAAVEVWGYQSGASHKPRLWLTAEGGYGWTAANKLTLKPDESSGAPQRLTPLDLGELSLSGPLFRITAAVSFW